MSVAGFVLTGGHSTRMGRDKALLPLGGQTLCEHIAGVVASVSDRVYLVGHPERYANLKYPCLADVHPDQGPLSGLETALCLNAAEFNIVTSCDVVNVQRHWFEALLNQARAGVRCVVIEDTSGQLQPLCAVYRSDCRPIVSAALADGRLRLLDLLHELGAHAVKLNALVLNLNTPEQYANRRI